MSVTGKRRGHGEGSITWDESVQRWVGRLPRDERGRRPKVTAKTRAEAQRKLRDKLRERDHGLTASAGRTTLRTFLEQWIRDNVKSSDLSPRTTENYDRSVRLHLVPGLGRVQLAKLTPAHVQRFITQELESGKGARTVQMAHSVLRNALGDAVRWGLVARNVASLVRGPSYRPGERRPFTFEEQRAILSAARNDGFYIVVVLAHAAGLRQSELLGIRWQDIAVDDGVLRARKQLGRDGVLRDLKSEAGKRAIPLPPSVVEVLREHRRGQDVQRADALYWEDHDLVYTTNVGRPVGHRNAHRSWTRIVKAAGVEHRGIHHMRHSYGTTLAERGVHERVAQYLLGHSDSRTTREIYTHVSDPMMDGAVEAITTAVEEATRDVAGTNGSSDGSKKAGKRDDSTDHRDGAGR